MQIPLCCFLGLHFPLLPCSSNSSLCPDPTLISTELLRHLPMEHAENHSISFLLFLLERILHPCTPPTLYLSTQCDSHPWCSLNSCFPCHGNRSTVILLILHPVNNSSGHADPSDTIRSSTGLFFSSEFTSLPGQGHQWPHWQMQCLILRPHPLYSLAYWSSSLYLKWPQFGQDNVELEAGRM